MSRLPVSLSIDIRSVRGADYRAHVTSWGVPDVGSYGSLWVRDLPLDAGPEASAGAVLMALIEALVEALAVL